MFDWLATDDSLNEDSPQGWGKTEAEAVADFLTQQIENHTPYIPMIPNQTFGQAIDALKQGKIVSREGWNGKNLFVFRQVPSEVPAAIIPKMTSLPQAVKDVLVKTGSPITYQNQFCIVYPDNSLHGWQPSGSDALATDWCIYGEHVVAGETVGTATPL